MKRYNNLTPSGLHFHLSLSDEGVCCIIVHDIHYCEVTMRYFTNINKALRFVNNLLYHIETHYGFEPPC